MNILNNYSPSILAIPAYHLITLVPHAIAVGIGSKGQPLKWDNRNPRSSSLKEKVKQKLDAESFAAYERAEACQANGFENAPLFFASIIAGNVAGLDQSDLNIFAGGYLALRVLYTVFYLRTNTQLPTIVRSSAWVGMVGMCWAILLKSASAMSRKTL